MFFNKSKKVKESFLWKEIGFQTNLYLLAFASILAPSINASSKSILSYFFIWRFNREKISFSFGTITLLMKWEKVE